MMKDHDLQNELNQIKLQLNTVCLRLELLERGSELVQVDNYLIKDEKFRKLLSDWAKLTQTTKIFVAKRRTIEGKIFTEFFSQEKHISLEFLGSFDEVDDMTEYTIAELCGEEEG